MNVMSREEREEIKDVEELRAVLKTVREEVPSLLRELVDPLRSLLGLAITEEEARAKARAMAAFYRELLDSGVDKETAVTLLKDQFLGASKLYQILREILSARSRRESEE